MIHFKIRHVAEVTSTNTMVLEAAKQSAQEGFVLVADHQTAGRGRPGRQWLSPPGKNLLCSILLRPPLSPAQAPMLTQIACRAVAKVLRENYDIASEFKRPNDVVVGSQKICGTLVESFSTPSKLEAVVIGIGLNVNAEASELPPEGISMRTLKNIEYSRDEILGHILDELAHKSSELYKNSSI
jgi:BirA family biotin operon repressor/biotin-[acetyl-CoA-carboxylase] ligase